MTIDEVKNIVEACLKIKDIVNTQLISIEMREEIDNLLCDIIRFNKEERKLFYNKAIDDFAISIKEYLNKFEVKNIYTYVLLDLMNRKAKKLKRGDKE